MTQNLIIALQITGVGMGLVFGSIVLLWLVMAGLVRLMAGGEGGAPVDEAALAAGEAEAAADAERYTHERKRKAAVAAVAAALALAGENDQIHEFPLPSTAIVSAWQAVLRANNARQRGPIR